MPTASTHFYRRFRVAARPVSRASGIFIILTGGVLLSCLLYGIAQGWERRALQSEIATRALERTQLLQARLQQSMDVLQSVGALFRAKPQVNRAEFRTFVHDALARQPELLALGYTPRVVGGERRSYEDAAREDGVSDFEFREMGRGRPIRASERKEYFPVYYIEPDTQNHTALGFELGSDKIRLDALQRARDTGAPAATPPISLVQEIDDRLGFVVYLPLYAISPSTAIGTPDSERELRGFASAVFRVDDLVRPALADLASQGLDVWITDETAEGRSLYHVQAPGGFASALPPPSVAGDLHSETTVEVPGRKWTVVLRPTAAQVSAGTSNRPRLIFLTGLLITVLLSGYMYTAMQRTKEIERRVRERTVQLSREVTERKRAEESAQLAEQAARLAEVKYRGIFENSVEGMFQTTPDGRYICANPALAGVYGYKSIDVLMSDLTNIARQLYVEPGRRDQFTRQVLQDGAVWGFESQVYRHDGSVIWISENARAVRDEHGIVQYYEGTVVDVTARKQAEGLLRRSRDELEAAVRERTAALARSNGQLQAEISIRKRAEEEAAAANRAKSAFLACMSHEIRTPMNAILGYAQLLHRDPSLGPSQCESVKTILCSGDHLLGLIDDVLDLSRIEAGRVDYRPAPFDLDAMLQDLSAMFRERCRQKGLVLRVDGWTADASSPHRLVVGDERKLRQVLINLLGNAVKFTDSGSVTLSVSTEANHVQVFEVADTGIGIPADAADCVFEPFQQTASGRNRGGTGLGLAIARQHVQLMGGELCFRSRAAVGSAFHFSLQLPPANPSLALRGAQRTAIGLAARCEVRALVVDDVVENRSVLAQMLSTIGCSVTSEQSGEAALRRMRTETFDVVFIDVMMPGMNGAETAAAVRRQFEMPGLRLIATSASALLHEQEACRRAGFDEFLAKPMRWERLYESLASVPGVTFRYAEPAEEISADDESAKSLAGLPKALRAQLLAAADGYRITELKRCIDAVESIGPAQRGAAEWLRKRAGRYALSDIAKRLRPESPARPAPHVPAEAATL